MILLATAARQVDILNFYYVWGNGPDFLLSFTTMLLVSFALRKPLNMMLGDSNRTPVRRAALSTQQTSDSHCSV